MKKEESKKIKLCPQCSQEMALFWQERKRTENAYSPERMHRLVCMSCGYSRTERFARREQFAYLVVPNENGPGLCFVENRTLDPLKRSIDATTIGVTE